MRAVAHQAICTTLYDLVLILHTDIGVDDDGVVTAFLSHLLRTKQITSHRDWPSKHEETACRDVDQSAKYLSRPVNACLASPAAQEQTGKPRTSHSERSHHEAGLLTDSVRNASW